MSKQARMPPACCRSCMLLSAQSGVSSTFPVSANPAGSSRMSQVALGNNQLTGSIPASWLALPTLALDLSSNQLSGSAPAPSSSNPVPRDLDLSRNRLSGPVSTSLDK